MNEIAALLETLQELPEPIFAMDCVYCHLKFAVPGRWDTREHEDHCPWKRLQERLEAMEGAQLGLFG